MPGRTVHVTEHAGSARVITVGPHRLISDEHAPMGDDTGPDPFELLLAGLGACTSATLRMYADRHSWELRDVQVRLRLEQGREPAVIREIFLDGDLDDDQRSRLMAVAGRCPVHRLLSAPPPITTVLIEHTVLTADDAGNS
ncbi:OsmC family protein [Streptomyces sp. NPDC002206]